MPSGSFYLDHCICVAQPARDPMEHEARITAVEANFDLWRKRSGLFVAPAVAIIIWFLPLPSLNPNAHHLFAVLVGVVVLWISEAVPLAITALLGPALCVLIGVGSAREVFKSFGDPVLFVYIGGFLIAEAMLEHGVNRRIAFRVLNLPWVGATPARVLAGFAAVTALISMWISNTATTAMMLPIGLAILSQTTRENPRDTGHAEKQFAVALMLIASFASSLGGLATPVGTPPNLIGLAAIERSLGVRISFFQWMTFGLPVALLLVTAVVLVFIQSVRAAGSRTMDHGRRFEGFRSTLAAATPLGPMSRAEKNVAVAFCVTVTLWIVPGLAALALGNNVAAVKWLNTHLHESVAALIGASLLFVLPIRWRGEPVFTLTWREAQRIDWGTILLFGGGLALGDLMFSTGLAKWIGEGVASAWNAHTTFALVALFTAVAIVVSETTSNAASATMIVPVAIAVAQGAGVNPLQPALAACLGASMGFMLPVSTPPNAIVYGSGRVPLLKMMRYGVVLDVLGFFVVVGVVYWWIPRVLF